MLTLSSIPGDKIPDVSMWQWDKIAHIFGYVVFSFLLFRYLRIGKIKSFSSSIKLTALISVAYALLDELHQIPIPNRLCTWQDLLANIIGINIGIFASLQYYKQKLINGKNTY